MSRQEHVIDITAMDRIASFQRKLEFWRGDIKKRQCDCFPTVRDFLIESNQEALYGDISQLLNGLQHAFQKYFPSSTSDANCVENPYRVAEKPDGMPVQNYECRKILHLILALKRDSLSFLLLNSGAVFFKNIRSCLKVQCLDCFHLPQFSCAKLYVQGTRQQNLNIDTDWMSHPT